MARFVFISAVIGLIYEASVFLKDNNSKITHIKSFDFIMIEWMMLAGQYMHLMKIQIFFVLHESVFEVASDATVILIAIQHL